MAKFIRLYICFALALGFAIPAVAASAPKTGKEQKSEEQGATRKERQLILDGNKLFNRKKYREAMSKYQGAMKDNPKSAVAPFNFALAQIGVARAMKGQDSVARTMVRNSADLLQGVARRGIKRNNLSSKAYYNLGNIAFNAQDYSQAVDAYKNALRLNPADNNARRNLRIAQLKKQQNDKNNKDKNKDKDKKDRQDKQDKQDRQNQPPQPQQQPQQRPKLDNQTSEQILQAIERKENQTRARQGKPQQQSSSHSRKNW